MEGIRTRKPSMPGDILKALYMEPLHVSITELAERLGVQFDPLRLVVLEPRHREAVFRFGRLACVVVKTHVAVVECNTRWFADVHEVERLEERVSVEAEVAAFPALIAPDLGAHRLGVSVDGEAAELVREIRGVRAVPARHV